jgi:hypothetical protein
MQIYTSDFLADTQDLSAEEIGAYALLLAALWNADGVLPTDEKRLARIVRLPASKWRKVWPQLERFFFKEGDGKLTSRHVKKWFSKNSVLGRMPLSAALRNTIFDRDGARCRYCGSMEGPFHVDHVVSVKRGGSDDPENLVIACMACNLSKGSKSLQEWRG